MLGQYFNLDEKGVSYFFGLVMGAAIVVTLLYWVVFGFDRWTGQMEQASNLMTAAVTTPIAQTYATPTAAGQYICPVDGAVGLPRFDANRVPHCPIDGQVMHFVPAQSGGHPPAVAHGWLPQGGQGGVQHAWR